MKYEAVFGNQDLFDGAGTFTGLDVVVHSIASGIKSYARLSDLTPESLRNHPVCAMRRIIQEPKRWTIEDQKAGRLPDVGSEVILRTTGEMATINAANKNMVCLTFSDGGFSPFNVERIDPIESPEEKAQREEDEFVASVIDLASENQLMSCGFKDGVISAYRKLKGGE